MKMQALMMVGLSVMVAVSAALSPSDFEITSLPGLKAELPFKQYSGYMPLNDGKGTELFFWFVEAVSDPMDKPVALWMNGGPGASSVGYGFWTEHGPFRLEESSDGTVSPVLYNYSWNKIANVIYVEAPAGVGFSFSNDSKKYLNITDAESSADNFKFLESFFNVFEAFKANDFYVTAESYGGHYGPTLAEQLIDNENSINMKGLLLGNPGINSDWYYNVNEFAFVTFMFSHGLIPALAYSEAAKVCGWNEFYTDCSRDYTHPTLLCQAATAKAVKYVPSPLDPYDVLAPTCQEQEYLHGEDTGHFSPGLLKFAEKYGLKFNPCLSKLTPIYLNQPAVLKAIHADQHYTRVWPNHPTGWYYNQGVEGEKKDIALLFPKFFEKAPAWKIVVISGTADAAVPFLGTERWMECLNRDVVNDTHAWHLNGDVAGIVKDWKGISLVTVKGCGHTIPTYCPQAGFAFFENWLTGNWN